MDPASADHIPVMEYSSGVTVLLFWATNTSVKSCVTSACSMAPRPEQGTDQHHGRQQPPVGPRPPVRTAVPARTRRRGTSPTTLTAMPARHATKASQMPIVPRLRVDHQQTGPADVTFTRFGYWAV